jgi:murein DD-endopeptidase MepM/ murein hydrolase activator NlpD
MPGAPISQPFGPTSLVLEPPLGPYPHFHTGLDLADPAGTPVQAAGDGIVVAAATGRVGYGNYIVIAHGHGVETLYGHLDALAVAVGDSVVEGQVIGFEGSTGFSTGPHLHFEVRVDGQFVDPLVYLLP